MKKWIKRILFTVLGLILVFVTFTVFFMYKVKNGLPIYEKKAPSLTLNETDYTVLVFSKTNGFRHGSAIKESRKAFQKMGKSNDWNMVFSNSGGVFNDEQLAYFDVVIWNNATGRNLTDKQRQSFKKYMESGGNFIGIHGAGDFSHRWKWYEKELIGADFTHHSLNPQFQEATMNRECSDSSHLCSGLPLEWIRSEEWYVFTNNPRENKAKVVYTVDENTFNPSGNLKYLVSDKDFGMGDDHPIVWYKCLDGGGKSFYSALGHSGQAFQEEKHLKLLENAIKWAGDKSISCE